MTHRTIALRTSAALAFTVLVGCAPEDSGIETGTGGSAPAGAAGTTGTAGTTGSAGTSGSAGSTGLAGNAGVAGAGNTGVAGNTGAAGNTGGAGATGAAGNTGGAGSGGSGGSTGTAGSAGGSGGSSAGRGGTGGGNAGRGGTGGGNAGRGGTGGSTAGSGGGGTTGGGGAGSYNPCPTNGDPCRILPVGDSITFGINQEGAWRIQLFRRAVMATQKITYTGTLQNGPTTVENVTFPRRYEATSGITIDGISNQITSKNTLSMPADIIVVHIGTNDMYMNPTGANTRLGNLLDKLIAGMPNALIVVAKIIPFPGGASATNTYNAAIPAVVQTRVAAGKHVIIVDLNTSFPSSGLSSDQVHPNVAGYAWMGDRVYDAIGSLFPR